MWAGTQARQKDRLEFPDAAGAAPGLCLPPLFCFGATDHVTINHETRIYPLPRAAAQQIAATRDPSGPSAEHARAPRLPSASEEAGTEASVPVFVRRRPGGVYSSG